MSNLLNIMIHNDVEKYNSRHYFIQCFIDMLEYKGHTYDFLVSETNEIVHIEKLSKQQKIEMIVNAKNITSSEYTDLSNLNAIKRDLTNDEILSKTKYKYAKDFKLNGPEEITTDFLNKVYNKTQNLYNNIMLHNIPAKLNNNILQNIKIDQYNKIKSIINTLGFDVNNKSIIISKEQYIENNAKVLQIINSKEYKTLFGCSKTPKEKFLINYDLLNRYGLIIESINKQTYTYGERQRIYTYQLQNEKYVDDYYKRCKLNNNNDYNFIDD